MATTHRSDPRPDCTSCKGIGIVMVSRDPDVDEPCVCTDAFEPVRVQLSRRRGWRMPWNTMVVARPSRWRNPFAARIPHGEALQGADVRAVLVEQFRRWLAGESLPYLVAALPLAYADGRPFRAEARAARRPTTAEIRAALAGRNLACWCPADQPCHADVLLEIANGGGHV